MENIKCPDCGSGDWLEWDDGYLCRCCGSEFKLNEKAFDEDDLEF